MRYTEAVAHARQKIHAGLDSDPIWSMIRERSAAQAIKIAADAGDLALILDWAEGDAAGFDALKEGICFSLERGEALHPDIVQWLLKYLRGEVSRPASKSGAKKAEWWSLRICLAVNELVEAGLSCMRNDVSEPTSACDAVADALAELGLSPTSYASVKRIWLATRAEYPFLDK